MKLTIPQVIILDHHNYQFFKDCGQVEKYLDKTSVWDINETWHFFVPDDKLGEIKHCLSGLKRYRKHIYSYDTLENLYWQLAQLELIELLLHYPSYFLNDLECIARAIKFFKLREVDYGWFTYLLYHNYLYDIEPANILYVKDFAKLSKYLIENKPDPVEIFRQRFLEIFDHYPYNINDITPLK